MLRHIRMSTFPSARSNWSRDGIVIVNALRSHLIGQFILGTNDRARQLLAADDSGFGELSRRTRRRSRLAQFQEVDVACIELGVVEQSRTEGTKIILTCNAPRCIATLSQGRHDQRCAN